MKSVLLSLLFLATTTFAKEPPAPAQQPMKDEIVVTASALPESLESTPAAVTVITRKDIEERGARDVADLLREVPGLAVSRTGSQGRATSLFTRGSNSTHTLVLWNGIEINNPYFAGYDWGRFSTAGVDQVEVVRGPFSALYGSEAVAGVVNVLTKPTRSGLRAGVEAGGKGLRNAQVDGSFVTERSLLGAALERRMDDGFARNDDFSQTTASLLWRWTPLAHLSAGVAVRTTSYDLGIPTNLNGPGTLLVPSLQRRQNGTERQVAIPFSQTLGNVSYDLTLSESHRSDDFRDPEDPYGFVGSTTRSTTRRARLTTRTNAGAAGTVVAGAAWGRATVTDVSNFGTSLDHERRTEKSLFLEDRLSRSLGSALRVEVSVGARYDAFDTFGSQTSPRAALAVVSGGHKVRAGFGRAFRAPSVGELYFPFSGNSSLRPEHSDSLELGYDRTFASEAQLSVTFFRGHYRDLIVFDNASYQFGNVGRADTRGVEIGATKTAGSFYGSLSYTRLDKPLPRRPRNSGSVFVGYRRGDVDMNVAIARSGERQDVLPVLPFSAVTGRAHTTVDVNLQMHLDRITPFVKIENATDAKFEEVRGYPSPRRRALIGLRFSM